MPYLPRFISFLLLTSILCVFLYVWACIHIFVCMWVCVLCACVCVHTYHNLFILLSVMDISIRFQLRTLMKKARAHICIQFFFQEHVFTFSDYLGVGLMWFGLFHFLRHFQTFFSKRVMPFYTVPAICVSSSCSASSPALRVISSENFSHFYVCEEIKTSLSFTTEIETLKTV